jgi:hypothetical protein
MTKQTNHPRRITPPAPPGSLLKRPMENAQRLKLREVTGKDQSYLDMVKECPCLSCGLDPCGEAAHLRMQSGAHGKHGGMQIKPADRWALPLCPQDHAEQHKIGEREFWGKLGINPHLVCQKLYVKRGDIPAMRAVVFAAMAERQKS